MKKLITALTIVALAVTTAPAFAERDRHEGAPHGRIERGRIDHDRFTHRGFAPHRFIAPHRFVTPHRFVAPHFVGPAIVGGLIAGGVLASRCGWQPGYWAPQPYQDQWGRVTYQQVWVPAQWVCD